MADHPLPVLQNKPTSSMGRWRALVLLGVHVAIAIHIVHWQVAGSTISPVEPSESMQTLEQGLVNAGFILFALSIVSTALFGRFFCGWACHVVALQDACTWILGKTGIRPRPFRTRLLLYAPLVLALYMFVWPNFKRHVLFPGLEMLDLDRPFWLKEVATISRFESELIVEDFWVTFPPWYIAIPFLLLCGFGTVYFLGNKGFCTYACPYGGFFAPVDKVSPLRIRVNDDCEHCGHCTAVCTSNVRVHEEVRDFGAVVNPGCMKCMDCVAACPNDALSLGLGKPAILTKARDTESAKKTRSKAKRRYDMPLFVEVLFAVLFLAIFLSYRGMMNGVPMLMAGGIGAIGVFLLWKAWETIRRPNARLHQFQFRSQGRLRPVGVAFLLFVGLFVAVGTWSATVRTNRYLSDLDYLQAEIPGALAVRSDFDTSDASREAARLAASRYARADAFEHGGVGWALDPDTLLRLAYFQTIAGETDGAIETIERIIEVGKPLDELVDQYVQLMIGQGRTPAEVKAALEHVLDRHPSLTGVRTRLASFAAGEGRMDEARALLDAAPLEDASSMVAMARVLGFQFGDRDGAVALLERARASLPHRHLERARVHLALASMAPLEGTEGEDIDRAIEDSHGDAGILLGAAGALGATDPTRAQSLLEEVASQEPAWRTWLRLAGMSRDLAFVERCVNQVIEAEPDGAWAMMECANGLAGHASGLMQLGRTESGEAARARSLELSAMAVEASPGEVLLRCQRAMLLARLGGEASAVADAFEAALERVRNPALAMGFAQTLEQAGLPDISRTWRQKATVLSGEG